MAVQVLTVPNDYDLFCGTINPAAGLPGGATGPQGATGPAGPDFLNHASFGFSGDVLPVNYGGSTVNVPYDKTNYNPSGHWTLQNGGATTANFKYTGSAGKFLVLASAVIQFNGTDQTNISGAGAIVTTSGQQGQSVGYQFEAQGMIKSIDNQVILTMSTNDTLSYQLTAGGLAADYQLNPSLGGGNISFVQIG